MPGVPPQVTAPAAREVMLAAGGACCPAPEPLHGLLSTDRSLPRDVFLLGCWGTMFSSTFPRCNWSLCPGGAELCRPLPAVPGFCFTGDSGARPSYSRQRCQLTEVCTRALCCCSRLIGNSDQRLGLSLGALSVSVHHPEHTRRCFLFILGKPGAVDWRREAGIFVRLSHEFADLL